MIDSYAWNRILSTKGISSVNNDCSYFLLSIDMQINNTENNCVNKRLCETETIIITILEVSQVKILKSILFLWWNLFITCQHKIFFLNEENQENLFRSYNYCNKCTYSFKNLCLIRFWKFILRKWQIHR